MRKRVNSRNFLTAGSKKHEDSVKVLKHTMPLTQMTSTQALLKDQVKQAELKVAAFVVEHNLPFQVMDNLSDLVSQASEFSSKPTKTRSIVKNVMAKRFHGELVKVLKHVNFSLIIDDSTDIASKKQLAIVVCFYCDREMRVRSRFFKLMEVTRGDAETLASVVFSQLEKYGIPCDNMIGFAADTTSVMFRVHHSVVTLLKKRQSHIISLKQRKQDGCLCKCAFQEFLNSEMP